MELDLRKIADSGQTFRMKEESPGLWRICAGYKTALIEEGQAMEDPFWRNYFDLQEDYGRFRAAIPQSDAFLTRAAKESCGIRILRQDPWEMLITFIISQRKNIPAIRSSVEAICGMFGSPCEEDPAISAFPSPFQLVLATEAELRDCGLGYRVPYIMKTAEMAAEGAMKGLEKLKDEELQEALLGFPGVGPKVANCVRLFGYHRIGAFPVDVWIRRILEQEYGGNFPLKRYEGFAGVLQQYMFYYGRLQEGAIL